MNSKSMIRQHLDFFHSLKCIDEFTKPYEILVLVVPLGHEDMPYPHLDPHVRKGPGQLKDIVIRSLSKDLMSLRIDMLDIEHHKIRVLHEFNELGMIGLLLGIGTSRSIDAGIDPHILCLL